MVKPGVLGKEQRSDRVVEMGTRVRISGRKLLRWPAVESGTCAGARGSGRGSETGLEASDPSGSGPREVTCKQEEPAVNGPLTRPAGHSAPSCRPSCA